MKQYDVAIVLGHFYGPWGFSSRNLKRLGKGRELFNQHKVKYLMVTGATGWFNQTKTPLAILSKNYLLTQKVPAAKILVVVEPKNTIDEAIFSLKALKKRGLTSAIVVSSFDHLLRAKRIFKRVYPSNFQLDFVGSDYFSGFWSLLDLVLSPFAWSIYLWHRLFRSL